MATENTHYYDETPFDIESAKRLRRKFRRAGLGIGFGLGALIGGMSGGGLAGMIGVGIFLALLGYVVAELSRIFIRRQRQLSEAKGTPAFASTASVSTHNRTSSYNSAVGGLVGIVAFGALIFYLNGQKDGSTSIKATNNIRSTAPEVLAKGVGTLDQLAKNCQIKNLKGELVGFVATPIPSSITLSGDDACKIAEKMVDEDTIRAKSFLDTPCVIADKRAQDYGSYANAIKAEEEAIRQGVPHADAVLKTLNMCTDTGRLQFARRLSMTLQVYSVGTFVYAGKPCHGYLQGFDITTPKGRSVTYGLRGTGTCENITDWGKNVFHPNKNPNGPPVGDYFRTVLHYDGALPKYWRYNGQQFGFVTNNDTH